MRLVALCVVALCWLLADDARADTATLDASRDNSLFSEEPTFSNGAGDFVFAGTTDDGFFRRALMEFDIAAVIPAGATITSVTLSLFNSRSKSNTAFDVSLHRATVDWGEGSSHASGEEGKGIAATPGDATWSHAFYDTTPWSSAGGDYAMTASATTPVDRDGRRFAWSSAAMAADVQAWLDSPAGNHGWTIVGTEVGVRTAKRFDSRQSVDTGRRPILTVVYTPAGIVGACCAADGTCAEVGSVSCTGAYQGDGSACSPNPCPQPTGACCASDGMCSVTPAGACSGSYEGNGTSCSPSPCPIPTGACCAADATCSLVDDPGGSCVGTYLGAATLCSPNPCTAVTGACCAADGTCSIVNHPGGSCTGTYEGRDTLCSPNPCPQPTGACCDVGGGCAVTTSASCAGTYQGNASMCSPNPCPQPTGACCDLDGSCAVTTAVMCTTSFLGTGLSCSPNPCPPPVGACCAADGSCSLAAVAACGGIYQGDLTGCGPNPCPQPTGACCASDGSCSVTTLSVCGGTFQGDATSCAADPCSVALTPFVDPLPLPAVATPTSGAAGAAAEYDIAIRQIRQQLHRDLPETTLWVYDDGITGGTYPGPTIEARSGQMVRVNWLNDLRDDTGALRTDHLLPVDPCPHGAELPGARTVVHLHGGHVAAENDGYPEDTFLPGEGTSYEYPNWQEAATMWFHDHALGITRLNVYLGLAALYLIRDDAEDALSLPSGEFEVPLVIQDRSFRADGSLRYPAQWQEHFFGDVNLVNGKVYPFHEVAPGKYRFRIVNGANSRTYQLYLSSGQSFSVIGLDGGLLEAPLTVDELTLGPAERADVIVDFEGLAPGAEVFLRNRAPAPFSGADDEGLLVEVIKFIVVDRAAHTDPIPAALRPLPRLDEADAVLSRDFELRRGADDCGGNAWLINGLGWDEITERPALGTTEIWRFVNRSGRYHPMHMHLVFFQVLDRQPFQVIGGVVTPQGTPEGPRVTESGWKDTVMVGPNEIVRVIARFEDFVGRFPYHCHILEHEDHEMMRQFETTTVCGDGARGLPLEACDDGNTTDGDGCSSTCMLESPADAGTDAAVPTDGGLPDAAIADGGTIPPGSDDGCGCDVPGGGSRHEPLWGVAALLASIFLRRGSRRPK